MIRTNDLKPSDLEIREVANGFIVHENPSTDPRGRAYGDETHVFADWVTLQTFIGEYYMGKINHDPVSKK